VIKKHSPYAGAHAPVTPPLWDADIGLKAEMSLKQTNENEDSSQRSHSSLNSSGEMGGTMKALSAPIDFDNDSIGMLDLIRRI
jgi:hypothetical protein